MTTVVRTRNPLETLSMNPEPQRRRSKRLASTFDAPMSQQPRQRRGPRANKRAAYDEADGDFAFTRKPKRSKNEAALSAVAENEMPIDGTKSRRGENGAQDEAPKEPAKKPGRRKMDFSTPQKPVEKAPARKQQKPATKGSPEQEASAHEQKRTTRRTRGSFENSAADRGDDEDIIEMVGGASAPAAKTPKALPKAQPRAQSKPTREEAPALSAPEPSANEPETQEITRTPIGDSSHAGTSKISLPFSDTPVIDRNKNFRKTKNEKRRSSLGLRGRRASGLIDSGHTATPHSECPTAEFYKHIEAEGLPEPRRMKQLLMWCGERALEEKPPMGGDGGAAILAARHIQEQLLKEFGAKSEMSDWFSREPTKKKVVKVKNPLNEGNAARIEELEGRLKRLKEEKSRFKVLLKPPKPQPISPLSAPINPALLDPESQQILTTLQSISASLLPSISERLKKLQLNLEFQTDVFAHEIHDLEQEKEEMEETAQSVLEKSKEKLEERDRRQREEVGTKELPTMEVLRALSKILPKSG